MKSLNNILKEALVKKHIPKDWSNDNVVTLKMFAIWISDQKKNDKQDIIDSVKNNILTTYRFMYFCMVSYSEEIYGFDDFVKFVKENEDTQIKIEKDDNNYISNSVLVKVTANKNWFTIKCDKLPSNIEIIKTYNKYIK